MSRTYLHRIEAKGFRSLRDVSVELRPLSVLVGPNGAGKSNLLSVIRFLGDTARLDLRPAIDAHGGFESLLYRGRLPSGKSVRRISLSIHAQVTRFSSENALDEYSLSFLEAGTVAARNESFRFKRTQGKGRRITVRGGKVEIADEGRKAPGTTLSKGSAALSTLPRLGPDAGGEQVGDIADLFTTFRVFDVDVDAARTPARVLDTTQLASDASNLAEFIGYLRENHEEAYALLQRDMSKVVPGFKGLVLQRLGGPAEAVAVGLQEAGLTGTTPLADASFGTVRALALLAMLHDPDPPNLTCIEEIDHGLHPHAIDVIVERMRVATERTQILVATHSPTFVNRLRDDELIVCERNTKTGESMIPAIDPHDLSEMYAGTTLGLGELWFSGALGGGLG